MKSIEEIKKVFNIKKLEEVSSINVLEREVKKINKSFRSSLEYNHIGVFRVNKGNKDNRVLGLIIYAGFIDKNEISTKDKYYKIIF